MRSSFPIPPISGGGTASKPLPGAPSSLSFAMTSLPAFACIRRRGSPEAVGWRMLPPRAALAPVAVESPPLLLGRHRLEQGLGGLRVRAASTPARECAPRTPRTTARGPGCPARAAARGRGRNAASGSSTASKWVRPRLSGSQSRIRSIESSQSSRSMSGGGVGGMTKSLGRNAHGGHVADEGAAARRMEVADVVGGVPGRVGDLEAEHLLAAAQRIEVLLRHRSDLAPEPLHLIAVETLGARQQLRGIGQVTGAALVHVDRELGPAPHQVARGPGVVEMDVGEQQRPRLLARRAPRSGSPSSSSARGRSARRRAPSSRSPARGRDGGRRSASSGDDARSLRGASTGRRGQRRALGAHHFGRRPLPGLHGAVEVAHPAGGRLGPRPVDPVDRLAKPGAVRGPGARPEDPGVAAARVRLGAPVLLDVAARLRGARPKTRAKPPTTASRRSASLTRPRARASRASRKPSSTPGEPLGGVLSKITCAGPGRLTADPERPSSRQNGSS